jgi:hypothetical protein
MFARQIHRLRREWSGDISSVVGQALGTLSPKRQVGSWRGKRNQQQNNRSIDEPTGVSKCAEGAAAASEGVEEGGVVEQRKSETGGRVNRQAKLQATARTHDAGSYIERRR